MELGPEPLGLFAGGGGGGAGELLILLLQLSSPPFGQSGVRKWSY